MALSPTSTFNNKYLDDLAFILLSPDLLGNENSTYFIESTSALQWISEEAANPKRINAYFKGYTIKKLGWYAESLMQYYFSNCKSVELLGHNIQLFDGKITTGEIDFLIRDQITNKIIQVELATKFYIKYGDQFIGPNATDNLEKKHSRLMNHQLQQSTPDEIRTITNGEPLSASKCLIKGIIFYPFQDFIGEKFSYPNYLATNHLKGWHLNIHDFMAQKMSHFYHLPKTEWLGMNRTQRIENKAFELFFKSQFEYNRAIMVIDENFQRGFITSDKWPN